MSLHLCTRLTRTVDGDPVECDMVIGFAVESFVAGCKATWDDPAEPAEYEFEVTSIEFDGPHDDAPGDLTDAERITLMAWFKARYDEACERAEADRADNFGDRADYLYERRRDELMMGERE